MLAGVRRLPRLACALAQRRHYLSVVLHGGDGTKPIALKLSVPWGKSPPAKPFEEVASPILRGLTPSAKSLSNNSRAVIKLVEETAVIASVELLPKPTEAECHNDEGEEERTIDSTSDEEDEWDDFYPMEQSSGDAVMDLFYQGGETEEEDAIEEAVEKAVESTEVLADSPSSSLVIDLCLSPRDLFAYATIHGQGNHNWRSSWSFNLDIDSTNEEISDPFQVQGLALSQYHDQPLEYRGVICGSILDKFKISLDTHYDLKEKLGSGAEGQVYRCESLDNSHICAVKWSPYQNSTIEEPRESLVMKKLCHPNVKRIFCAWKEYREDFFAKNSVFLAQELSKCPLEDYLDEADLTSSDRIKIFAGVVSGVSYLHAQGIVHRDIKCSNIFLDDHGCAKIGDFGQSGLISSRSCSYGGKLYGTLLYGAPELAWKQRHGVKSDIFSLGLVYAELFGPTNVAAERLKWLLKLRELIKSRQWKRNPLSTWKKSKLSKDWTGDAYLMINMLESSPEERPSCSDILEVLTEGARKP